MRKTFFLGLALALAAAASTLLADEPKKQDAHQAEMQAMMKAATPGEAHKKLDNMIGTWNATVKMWMEPGAPPVESHGISEAAWVLGGRWVEEKFNGDFMGMPFNGIGYSGYDNIKKQYVGTWMDNMSTSVMLSTGKADDGGKSYTFTTTMDDPMTGKSSPVTEKLLIVDADHHVMEMWAPAPDGKNFKMMEITYSRKK